MLVSRIVSLVLRVAEFIFAAIVLGLSTWFLWQRTHSYVFLPYGRIIYVVIISSLAILGSLFSMIPTKASIASYGSDLFFTVAWFAAFAVYADWYRSFNCGGIWVWNGMTFSGQCGRWSTNQAFSFLSAITWCASFVLGVITHHRLTKWARTEGTK
ncbi:hypothetical protein CC80DRAFT_558429 [Byssothecium circinans]|uniref:MARVEL domain-containing protein n=1 Tax=Byssothecium circinans TaxID=147558 RepID=A0A6A5U2I4_9PLEO|nr:hypothetical protein CC80DRAFT_558429 [Byssothecium circinans]